MIELERHDGIVPPQFNHAIGDRTGLVGTLFLKSPYRGAPKAYQTANTRCDIEYLLDYDGEMDLGASGKGTSLAFSMTSCVGESIERYSLCWPDESDIRWESYDALVEHETVVDFDYLNVYSDSFRERFVSEFTRGTEIPWVAGTNLSTGEETWVPAEYVWMRVGPLDGVPTHVIGSSNGVAAGPSIPEALLWAIYESVERDGIMRTWWEGHVPDRIDIDSDPELRQYVDEHFPHKDLSMHLFECETLVDLPTYGSTFVNAKDEYPKFAIAGAAALDQKDALFDAASEVLQGWPYLHDIAVQYDLDEFDIDEVVTDYTRNVLYYAQPGQFSEVERLFEGDVTELPNRLTDTEDWSVDRKLGYVLEKLDDAGCTPIGFDVTAPDVRQCGTHVVRAFVPELIDLTPPAAPPVGHPEIDRDRVIDNPHPFP